MQEHIITKEDGSKLNWSIANNNNAFCLLYKDNKQKYKFTPTENLNCELFMIGGGGPGGYFFGGGGGAGAAYINNNYTFKKNKTYTFDIGSGGTCDIENINNLFKSGLNLNIYNNTAVKLNNVNFMYDDYSSIGIENSAMKQSFNVNNITIPASIFKNNTTYIWDGYIKSNSTGNFNIIINSKISTIIWIDKYIFNNVNSLIEGDNLNDVKRHNLDANRYYNIKIIAYNNNSTSNNFNITFEGCQLFNFDKKGEKYIYKASTDTTITYQNDNNTFETLRCKGGGYGGCGFYNKNTNLDGGCGGGSGINKIKGSSIIEAIYNGYDGAIGEYCGGGGGIISAGNDNRGGNGKIINWFSNDLIFGAGGNAANLNDNRKLGYGSGGNGGECCYYSKLAINNNGNNGCILIYINSNSNSPSQSPSPPLIESFSTKTTIMIPDTSIVKKLLDQSFSISKKDKYTTGNGSGTNRADYFNTGNSPDDDAFIYLADNYDNTKVLESGAPTADSYKKADRFKTQTYIYDILVISKLFAILYRLYLHHYNTTLNNDVNNWKTCIDYLKIKLHDGNGQHGLTGNASNDHTDWIVNIYNFNNITSLKLGNDSTSSPFNSANYNNELYKNNSGANLSFMLNTIVESYTGIGQGYEGDTLKSIVPLYHNINTGEKLHYFNLINTDIAENKYRKISIGTYSTTSPKPITNYITHTDPTYNGDGTVVNTSGNLILKLAEGGNPFILNRDLLNTYYNEISKFTDLRDDNYSVQRVFLYLEVFNIIFNTEPKNMLITLKYWMHHYNLLAYNASIQYGLLLTQNARTTHLTNVLVNYPQNKACYKQENLSGMIEYVGPTASGNCGTGITKNSSGALYTYQITQNTSVSSVLAANITILSNNLDKIRITFNDSKSYDDAIDKIITTSSLNQNSTDNYYNEQLALNKTINDYNNELENYNNLSYYYKIVIAFGIVLLLLIIIIFNYSGIDNNSKISIYAIIIILIIIAYIFYNQYSGVKEGFTAVLSKSNTTNQASLPEVINVYIYRGTTVKYINALLNVLTNNSLNGTMTSSLNYIKRISSIKNDKAEYYKVRKMNLINSMEVLKKSSKYYYYIIILIAVSIMIFNIGIILYLLSPNNIIPIVVLCMIPFIILIYYVSYQIHRSTRLAENKNYWANFNPSDETLNKI